MSTFRAGLLTLVLLVGSAGQSRGLTGMEGMRGTFRAVSGDTETRGSLALNLWFDYWRKAPDTTRQEEMTLTMALSSSPRRSVELYGVTGFRRFEEMPGTAPSSYSGLTDTEIGLKLVRLTDSWLLPGMNLSLTVPTGTDKFSTGGIGFGSIGAVTFDFSNFESFLPLRAHLNFGYERPGGTAGYRLPLRTSVELPTRYFTPIVEVSSEQSLGDTLSFSESPLRFTQGVKATPFRWVSLSLGYDINLARETVLYTKSEAFDWRIFFGVTAAKSLSGLGPRPGTVYGTVTDRETGRPVAARITLRGGEVTAATDPETGLYSLEVLSEGLLGLVIEAQGYKKRVVPAVAVPGEKTERNIELTAAVRLTRLSLAAEDRMSGQPVPAVFRLAGKEVHEATADSSGSSEVLEVPSGEYELVCSAPGYLKTKRRIEVSVEHEETLVLALLRHGEAMVISGVGFAGSTANLKIESDVGVREVVELLHSNPEVRFEIAGHTDDTGSAEADSALSLKRASVFSRFLVKGYEIGEDRLVAKGYGAANPIAPSNTEEGRKKNRRLEIRAL